MAVNVGARSAAATTPRVLGRVRTRWQQRPGVVEVWLGSVILLALLVTALAAPLLTGLDPLTTDASALTLRPGAPGHPLGTDILGRDLLARVLYGGRTTLAIGVLAASVSVLLGVAVGAAAASGSTVLEVLLMRLVDGLLTLPVLVVVIAIQAVTAPSLVSVIIAIGLTSWMPVSRVVRTELASLRERGFMLAARAVGTSGWNRMVWHLLPNALPPVLVICAFQVAHAIATESTLSFLGLGVPINQPTWGNMLNSAQEHVLTGQWWMLELPGAAIILTLLAVNLLADGVRLISDPRQGLGQ